MSKENLYTKGCIRTHTGEYLNVFDPKPEQIHIEDIAHALSQMPRFAGHLKSFYSVAQHSLICAELAPPGKKLLALMHDASEAYLMDMPKPIKERFPEYKIVEDHLMEVIAQKFGFAWPMCDEMKAIDKTVLEMEWDQLMLGKHDLTQSNPPARMGLVANKILPLSCTWAEMFFTQHFLHYSKNNL